MSHEIRPGEVDISGTNQDVEVRPPGVTTGTSPGTTPLTASSAGSSGIQSPPLNTPFFGSLRGHTLEGVALGLVPAKSGPWSRFFLNVANRLQSHFETLGGLQYLTAAVTYDFPNTAAQTSSDTTLAVTGALIGDHVSLSFDPSIVPANSDFKAWVSAMDEVTIRFNNYSTGAIDPASGDFYVRVWRT